MLSWLESIDHLVFKFLNQTIANPIFDAVFPNITDLHKQMWLKALVPVLLIFWLYRHRLKALRVIVILSLTIALVDNLSAQHLKSYFQRQRPPSSEVEVSIRTKHFSGYSLPSIHAANNFTIATVISSYYPPARIALFTSAVLIAYSRVYVGVHFPFDIFAGALLGIFLSLLMVRIYEIFLSFFKKKNY